MTGLSLDERALLLSAVSTGARQVLMAADLACMAHARELEMQRRRRRERDLLENVERQHRMASLTEGEVATVQALEVEMIRTAQREREADEQAGWVGIYRGGSVVVEPEEEEEEEEGEESLKRRTRLHRNRDDVLSETTVS